MNTTLPAGVTAQLRTDGETDYVFIMNFSSEKQTVLLDDQGYMSVAESEAVTSVDLPL